MGRDNLSGADDVYLGRVAYNRANNAQRGVKVTPELRWMSFGAIVLADADGVSASQSVTAAASFLINGALAAGGVATFDVPRNVVGAWTTASIITVTGTDLYGSIITEAFASGTSFTGKKAFKTITAVTSSASITGATIGSGVVIGLPNRVDQNGYLLGKVDGATDAGTFVAAVTTNPATAATGDVRGTITFTSAPDSTKVYAVFFKIADVNTKEGTYGVKQFGSTDLV